MKFFLLFFYVFMSHFLAVFRNQLCMSCPSDALRMTVLVKCITLGNYEDI